MIRLHVTAEGQTEQAFVKNVLAPHLGSHGVYADSRCVLTSKDKRAVKSYRGGLTSYAKAKNDIISWLKEDRGQRCRFTTMFDLYALPQDFPGYVQAEKQTDPYMRVDRLERALAEDINDTRFVPYIQLHEFESLILADPQKLDWEYMEHDEPIKNLAHMVGTHNPELINDGSNTAPSKRILREIPEYDKVGAGVLVTEKIGIETLRLRCPHFGQWLTALEQLGN